MDTTELLKHGAIAARLCKQWGHAEDAEDASQYVIEARLRGRKGKVSNILIDYLRGAYGATGVSRRSQRQNHESRAAFSGEGLEVVDSRVPDPGARIDGERELRNLDKVNRAAFILQNQWGFSEVEIGHLFGVTGSRICQKLKGVEGRLSKSQKRKPRSSKEGTRKVEAVERIKRQEVPERAAQTMAREESREVESLDVPCFEEWLT